MICFQNILETVGRTPIIKLNKFPSHIIRKNIYAKLESFNPGRSVKDRIALNMINTAEQENLINKDTIIVESSSGNTGIALSMISRVKSYRNVVVVDQNCPKEKILLLKALGAIILLITYEEDSNEDLTQKRICLVNALKKVCTNVFVPNQYENSAAPSAHYLYTAQEIISFMEINDLFFDAIFISVGTGGTITGVSKRIKEYNPSIEIIAIEPLGSTLFGGTRGHYLQQGPGNYFIPKNLDIGHIDAAYKVSDTDAFNMCRKFALEEGILVGGSSGAILHKAAALADSYSGNVLCILPDGGEKYLTSIYDDDWLKKQGIILDKVCENPVIRLSVSDATDYHQIANELRKEIVNHGN